MHSTLFERDSEPSHQVFFDPTASGQPLNAINSALTTVMDRSPTEITPLYETIDPAALETLLEHAATSSTDPAATGLEFTIEDWTVVVTGTGRVQVYGDSETELEQAVELEFDG